MSVALGALGGCRRVRRGPPKTMASPRSRPRRRFAGQRELRDAAAQLVVVAARGGVRIVSEATFRPAACAQAVSSRMASATASAAAMAWRMRAWKVSRSHSARLACSSGRRPGGAPCRAGGRSRPGSARGPGGSTPGRSRRRRHGGSRSADARSAVRPAPRACVPANRTCARHGFAAQAAFPGQGEAVEFGGDAIGQQLSVDVEQGAVGKGHAGTRHDGAFEGVAMQIHDAGQHQQPAGVEPRCVGGGLRTVVDPSRAKAQAGGRDAAGGMRWPAMPARGEGRACGFMEAAVVRYNQMSR